MPLPSPFKLISAVDAYSGKDTRTLYTVPAGKQAFIKSVLAANMKTAATSQPTLQIVKGSDVAQLASPVLAASAASNLLAGTITMAAGESLRQRSDDDYLFLGQPIYLPSSDSRLGTVVIHDMIRAGAVMVAVGTATGADPYNNLVLTSADAGATWTFRDPDPVSSSARVLRSIAYDATGNVIVIVGDGGFITTSSDGGVTWVPRTSALSGDMHSVIRAAGKFVACCSGSTTQSVQTSADGVTWVARTGAVAVAGSASAQLAYDATVGLFAMSTGAAGNSGGIQTSPDAITWTQRSTGVATVVNGMQAVGGRLVARQASVSEHRTSTDGATWAPSVSPGSGSPSQLINAFKAVNGRIFVSYNAGISYTSDGVQWVYCPIQAISANLFISFDGVNYLLGVLGASSTGFYKHKSLLRADSQAVNFTASVIEVSV